MEENILQLFQDVAERRGDAPCLRYKNAHQWQDLSWLETLHRVRIYSESLKQIDIGFYDRVAILSSTRYEWTLLDMAILSLGAVTVPIYQSSIAPDIEHILNDSECRVLFIEDLQQFKKIESILGQLPHLKKIILLEGDASAPGLTSLADFAKAGEEHPSDFGTRIREVSLENLATLVYTSGTTGKAKGVMISHGNIVSEVKALQQALLIPPEKVSLFFLPLAHILARAVQFLQLASGFVHAYAESIDRMIENILEVRPHFMASVPRIFEKIYSKTMSEVENSSGLKKKIFYWALEVGKAHSKAICAKQPIPTTLRMRYQVAHSLVFSKLHKKLGGRLEFFVSGGAPLSKDIAEFFHAAGILILEGYGLTETTAGINISTPDNLCFGTVGKAVAGAIEKIAADGEILVKGPLVSQGYWKLPQATAEAFVDGWFHTGDIGVFDEAGNLKITDRKKDIIVTAGGKNVAPQNIENLLKTSPVFSQVVVHGDRRKYLSALVTLNADEVKRRSAELNIHGKLNGGLSKNPKVNELVKKIIEEKNAELPQYESIKRFAILDQDFTVESGELTPTLKVKRKLINERYKAVLDKLYSES